MVARAMRGLARPGAENGSDRGENEKNWLRKARSVISGVFSGAMPRLTCYSSARGSKSARVDARGCVEAAAEDEKEDGLERTGPDSGELIYGSGRGGARRSEGSARPLPLSWKDERRGEKAGPYGQIVLLSERHQRRAMLRLSTVFKKNPSAKSLDVEVGKSNGNDINIGAETIRARAVAWAWMKLQCARQKTKVKTVCYKVSNPIKEEDGDEEEGGGELELCKKRILMGRRCKPLNCSGTLQYDDNGILLPESPP